MVHYQSFYSLQSSYLCEMSISHKYGHLSGTKKRVMEKRDNYSLSSRLRQIIWYGGNKKYTFI